MDILSYKKAILHCLRYPTNDVFGILLSKGDQSDICEAVPLFHNRPLDLMLEVGFNAVEGLYKEYKIVGFYEALQHNRVQEVSELTMKVVEAIAKKNGKGFVLKIWQESGPEVLDTKLISVEKGVKNTVSKNEPCFKETMDKDLKSCNHWKISDFEDHLQDLSKDFKNEWLTK